MSNLLIFKLELKPTDGLPLPNARLWLDLSEDFGLQDGEEITLSTLDRHTWTGQRALPEGRSPKGLFFLLRFVAPKGSQWTFEVTQGSTHCYQTKSLQTTKGNREALTGLLKGGSPSGGRTLGGRRRGQ